MEKLGRFESVTLLSPTALGAVWTARASGSANGTPYAVKLFEPVDGVGDPAIAVRAFLQGAGTQQTVASKNPHWAPVHESGTLGRRAFFVTDYYPRSAQWLIRKRVRLKSAGLYRLIDSTVRGLQELRATCGRLHGNLKPSNVMIQGGSDLRRAGVFLADPSPTAHNDPAAEIEDVRAIGILIHELVLHRPFVRTAWPVAESQEWSALGPASEKWRNLCNALLHPIDDSPEKTLDHVAKSLKALSPGRLQTRVLVRAVALAVGAAVLGVLIGLAYLVHRADSDLRRTGDGWAPQLAKALRQDPALRERFVADTLDPELQNLVAAVEGADAAERSSGIMRLLSIPHLLEARRAAAGLSAAREALRPERWARLKRLGEFSQQYRQWGWNQAATYLDGLGNLYASQSADLGSALAQIVELEPILQREKARIAQAHAKVENVVDEWRASSDPQFQRFAATLNKGMDAATKPIRLARDGWTGLDSLETVGIAAAKAHDAVIDARNRGWPGKIDRAGFDAGHRINDPLSEEDRAEWVNRIGDWARQFDEWGKGVDDYVWVRATDSDAAAAAPRALAIERIAKLDEELKDIRQSATGDSGFDRASGTAADAIHALRLAMFIARDVRDPRGPFAGQCNAIDETLGKLRNQYVQRPDDWLKQVPATVTVAQGINQKWQEWLTELQAKLPAMKQDVGVFHQYKETSEAWRMYLVDLDRNFLRVPPELTGSLAQEASKAREKAIVDVISSFHPAAPLVTPAIQPSADRFAELCRGLAARQKNVNSLSAEAQVKEQQHDYVQALALLQRLVELAPDSNDARQRLEAVRLRDKLLKQASAAMDQSRPTDAMTALDALGKLDTSNPVLPGMVARARTMKGEMDRRAQFAKNLADVRSEPDPVLAVTLAQGIFKTTPRNVQAQALVDEMAAAARQKGLAEYGRGTDAGYQRAAVLFRAAIEGGNADAMVNLGGMTLNGLGVPRDYAAAATLFEGAAAKGNPEAKTMAGRAYQLLGETSHDDTEAAGYFEQARQAGEPTALFRLGLLYEDGRGVARDHNKAMELIGQAAKLNVPEARRWLDNLTARSTTVTPPPPPPPPPPPRVRPRVPGEFGG